MGLSFQSSQTNDKYRFCFEGWYYGDILGEIQYWEDALNDPEDYDTTIEYAQEQIEIWEKTRDRFEAAFEAQRTDKVDYEDGTWV
jgi:hypothetical protein